MADLALIDYGSGNLHSAARALTEAARRTGQSLNLQLVASGEGLESAARIVLPGVGHFADCAAQLRARPGLAEALQRNVIERGKPFLGICVGMQLMASLGLEDAETPGLGWIAGTVSRLDPGPGYRVPHMGWNALTLTRPHPILEGLGPDPHVYFTHSYAFHPESGADIAATTDYGSPFPAAVARGNLFGTQFHPEKSQAIGLTLLGNFLTWSPA